MKNMKAYTRMDANTQEVQISEVPIPKIQHGEVLIEVKAFGVGIHDRYFIPMDVSFPYTIGSEGSGIISELGEGVTGFKKGDRMIFTTVLQPQGGSWAEYATVKQEALILLPDELIFAQGAALPIATKTALECMRSIQLNKGDTLFIAGASGAIGTFVIQLAASKGIRVSASASQKNQAYMKSLGAEKTVDYQDENWQSQVKEWSEGGVTAALAIQPGTGIDSIKVVKDGGKLITVSGDSAQVVPERGVVIEQMGHHHDTQQKVIQMVHDIAKGAIQLVIEKEYQFDEALDALMKTETRHARGKLVATL